MSEADRIEQLEEMIGALKERVDRLEVLLQQDSVGSGKSLDEVVFEALSLAKRRGLSSPWQ